MSKVIFGTFTKSGFKLGSEEKPWSLSTRKRRTFCLASIFSVIARNWPDLYNNLQQVTGKQTSKLLVSTFGNAIDECLDYYCNLYSALLVIISILLLYGSNLINGISEYDSIKHGISHALRYLMWLHGQDITLICSDSGTKKCVFTQFIFAIPHVCLPKLIYILLKWYLIYIYIMIFIGYI